MKLPEISTFIAQWPSLGLTQPAAWRVAQDCENQVLALLSRLGTGYRRHGNCAIHESAIVEEGAVLKAPGVRIVVASPVFPKKAYRGRKETGRAVLFT